MSLTPRRVEKQQAGVEQLGILLSDSRSKSSILHRQNGRKKIGRLPNADTRRRAEGVGLYSTLGMP